jgi:hypothetical protein
MRKRTVRRVLLSPWTIGALLALGWGPIFVDDYVATVRPDLDAAYVTQGFAMGWMGVTVLCSLLAILLTIVYLVRFVLALAGRLQRDRNGNDRQGRS